jgi:predicted nucleotidyltransferase
MAYTVRDTPDVVRRIDGDLARVVAAVRAADPRLRSLVLTGGFARGEGTVLRGAPQNDYDFVAIRSTSRPSPAYARLQGELEAELGLHIDLAPIAAWRLPFVARSIFWYETAVRGRVLWGDNLLGRIGVRGPAQLDRAEGLRLLVNRSAGLLLVTPSPDAHAHRIQAAKALLAAMDATLLAAGAFAPTQVERWQALERLREEGREPRTLAPHRRWLAWAFAFKVDPATAPPADHREAWSAARKAVLQAVPVALAHAGLSSLQQYARRDGLVDRAVFLQRSAALPEARRLAAHPTARLRVATLRLLASSPHGRLEDDDARRALRALVRPEPRRDPVALLDGLRRATLQ